MAWQRPTLAGGQPPTTIGAEELNDRVRDGNGCDLFAIIARPEDKHTFKTGCNRKCFEHHYVYGEVLDRLVSVSFMCHHTSTPDLSTSSSLRGLTNLTLWEISS